MDLNKTFGYLNWARLGQRDLRQCGCFWFFFHFFSFGLWITKFSLQELQARVWTTLFVLKINWIYVPKSRRTAQQVSCLIYQWKLIGQGSRLENTWMHAVITADSTSGNCKKAASVTHSSGPLGRLKDVRGKAFWNHSLVTLNFVLSLH